MSYIQQYIGKTLNELSYLDIQTFFLVEREESDRVEFKSYVSANPKEDFKEKEKAIIRTIGGMLNSSGGIIIWGAPVGKEQIGKKEKIYSGLLSPVAQIIEKDAFINKLADSIIPSPNGINFGRLEYNQNYIYLFEVRKSEYSPHQYQDKYWMRLDGQTRPAPHHYIEALFKKITHPKLSCYFKPTGLNQSGGHIYMNFSVMFFNGSRLQNEHNLYYRLLIDLGRFSVSSNLNVHEVSWSSGDEIIKKNAKEVFYYNEPILEHGIVILKPSDLKASDGVFSLVMFIGGKVSPLITSDYKIKIDWLKPEKQDLTSLIIEKHENRYMHEVEEDTDTLISNKAYDILTRL